MNKEIVYVTFPKGEVLDEWINNFLSDLRTSLKRVLGYLPSILVKEADFDYNTYTEAIQKSSAYIFLTGTNGDDEEGYRDEIETIVTNVNSADNPDYSNLLCVKLSTVSSLTTIENIDKVQVYNFYEQKGRKTTNSRQFSFQADRVKIWSKLLDLSYDIKELFKFTDADYDKYVYLGSCSADQQFNRDDIKREIQHHGYKVLPTGELPKDQDAVVGCVNQHIPKCKFVIQVIGGSYGEVVSGNKQSNFEAENRALSEKVKENKQLLRLIWISEGLRMIDQKQQLYLNRIRREELNENTELVESGIEDFKTLLVRRMSEGKVEAKKAKMSGVYYLSKENEVFPEIKSFFNSKGTPLFPRGEAETTNYYRSHLEKISNADAILVDNSDNDGLWLSTILKDIVKAIGLGRDKPLKSVGIITNRRTEQLGVKQWLPQIVFIDPEGFNGLQEFINIVQDK